MPSWLLAGWVDFWGVSPGYVLIRLGALVLLLRAVEWADQTSACLTPIEAGVLRSDPLRRAS